MNLSIVIPAYNESKRLPLSLETLAQLIGGNKLFGIKVEEILVVDDGSTDNTIQIAKQHNHILPQLRVIESGKNYGKGHAVRLGLKNAMADWILVSDADMSTPWTEVNKLARYKDDSQASIAIGSRELPESEVKTSQSFLREYLGRIFNLFVRSITGLKFKDTQCGFKLFNRSAIHDIIPILKVNRFAWDVEFLMKAKKLQIKTVEVPVEWEHRDMSHVRPFKDGINMAWTVLKIRLFY